MKRKVIIVLCVVGVIICAAGGCYGFYRCRYPYHFRMAEELSMDIFELRRWYGGFSAENERFFGMMTESADGNWTKVSELAGDGEESILLSYYANLSAAMRGVLPDSLMYRYQPFGFGLFLPLDEESSRLWIMASGEVWYRLGEMTMAEHGAILGMVFSPKQRGPFFFRRLSQISLINGEEKLAEKYLRLLGEPLSDDWKEIVPFVPEKDFVHSPSAIRSVLKNLVRTNQQNSAAYDYLLCYDLIVKEIGWFAEDYEPERRISRLYQEAALILMASTGNMDTENISRFDIDEDVLNDFHDYSGAYGRTEGDLSALEERFRHTYWFYFHFARRNENGRRI